MGEDEESGVVCWVVGDVSGEDFHVVEFGGFFACDGCCVEELFFFDDFDASGGVVGGDDFPFVPLKVAAALRLVLVDGNKLFRCLRIWFVD